jgi:hypothetical protein
MKADFKKLADVIGSLSEGMCTMAVDLEKLADMIDSFAEGDEPDMIMTVESIDELYDLRAENARLRAELAACRETLRVTEAPGSPSLRPSDVNVKGT